MIELKQISKQYQLKSETLQALSPLSLNIESGDIFGIVGYSGAGKSTLIRLINLLERPTSGEVIIDGHDLTHMNAQQLRQARQSIGMIFQHFNLLSTKTVFENIAMPLKLAGCSGKEIENRVLELLEFVDLTHKRHALPGELSGGQKQRVGIARALANRPKILLCDEATSALDPQTTQSILALLKQINRTQQITIVMVTHEMEVIRSICQHMAVMEHGHMVEHGLVVDIFRDPKHPTTQTFIHTVLEPNLPESIFSQLEQQDPKSIYRLEFLGKSARQTVVQRMIQKYQTITVNILFGNMSAIDTTVLGSMFVQILGESTEVEQAIQYLRAEGVRVTERAIHV